MKLTFTQDYLKLILFISFIIASSNLAIGNDEVYTVVSNTEVDDFHEILKETRKLGREPILYFSGDWCPPCRKIKEKLEDPIILEKIKKYRIIEVDIKTASFQEGEELVTLLYHVRTIPKLMALDNDNLEKNQAISRIWTTADKNLQILLELIWPDKSPELKQRIENNKLRNVERKKFINAIKTDTDLEKHSRFFLKDSGMSDFLWDYMERMVWIHGQEDLDRIIENKQYEDFILVIFSYEKNSRYTPIKLEEFEKLKLFTNLKYLRFDHLPEIPDIVFSLKQLEALTFTGAKMNLENLHLIKKLENLRYLYFGGQKLTRTENLKYLYQLEFLGLGLAKVSNYQDLYAIPNLKGLSFRVDKEEYLEGISQLQQLEYLYTNKIHKEISDLPLRTLGVDGRCTNFDTTLKGLTQLDAIGISRGDFEMAPDFIADNKELKLIAFRDCMNLKAIPESYSTLAGVKYVQIFSGKEPQPLQFPFLEDAQTWIFNDCYESEYED